MKYLLLLLLFLGVMSCKKAAQEDTQTEETVYEFKLPEWAKNSTMYEANTRHMSEDGSFKGLEDQLPRLKEMGIDIIWMMPIHPVSMKKRKATGDLSVEDIEDPEERKKYLGSPYSVADYKDVNPDMGSMDDFKSLLAAAHAKDMKIIIDWVPNHTGWDHPWITDHPYWYTQDSLGNIIDPIDYNTGESWGWTDVADLNYDNQKMRAEMIASMKYWLTDIGIDGFRVDVAHGVPQNFWDEACKALVETKSDVFLLAESEVPSNRNNKTFHMDYGWAFHHLMNDITKGNHKAKDIDEWFVKNRETYQHGFHMHFTSNHDENAWAGNVVDRMGDAHLTMAVLAATFDGMPLLYSGMEVPIKRSLEFFEKDLIDFANCEYADFYKTLFDLKHRNQAIWNGEYGGELVKMLDHDDVYAFKREKNGDVVVGILNLSASQQSITLPADMKMKDVFTNQSVDWKAETALALEPWQYYLLSSN